VRYLFIVVAGLMLWCASLGCAAPSWWTNVPEQDRQLFQRCAHNVSTAQCGASYHGDEVYRSTCNRGLSKKYADTGSAARRQWLIAHGCPAAMVNAY